METGEVSKVTHSRYGLLSVSCTAPATPKMCNSGRCAWCSHASSRVLRRRDCLGLRLLIRTRNLPEELPMLRSEVLHAGCHCLVRPRVELSIQLRWVFESTSVSPCYLVSPLCCKSQTWILCVLAVVHQASKNPRLDSKVKVGSQLSERLLTASS